MNTIKVDAVVGPDGKVIFNVPFPAGTSVEVLVCDKKSDDCRDLVQAAQSSLSFWDNPMDDEDWNAPGTR